MTLTNGSDVTGTTDGPALVTDGRLVPVDMHTLVASTQVVGEVFTVAGVYACHPETKASLGYLQQFTITAIGSPSTTTISPATTSRVRSRTCASRTARSSPRPTSTRRR
jgi:hypothetical protein